MTDPYEAWCDAETDYLRVLDISTWQFGQNAPTRTARPPRDATERRKLRALRQKAEEAQAAYEATP
jgi:hypothetical protein